MPHESVLVGLVVGEHAQVLEVHDIEIYAGAREQVPPGVQLEQDAKRQLQQGPADEDPEGAEVHVELPQEIAGQEDGDAESHGVAQVAAGTRVADVLGGERAGGEHNKDVEHGVGGLVDGGVAVDQVDHGEGGGGAEDEQGNDGLLEQRGLTRDSDGAGGAVGTVGAFGEQLALLAEDAPGGDAGGVDHGQLVEQLVLVLQGHVEEPRADAHGAEAEADHGEALFQAVVHGGPRHEYGQQHEEPVGDRVGPLGDEGRHDVVFLAPVDGRRGLAPVADLRGLRVRLKYGTEHCLEQ